MQQNQASVSCCCFLSLDILKFLCFLTAHPQFLTKLSENINPFAINFVID